jgi:hypothetical protein
MSDGVRGMEGVTVVVADAYGIGEVACISW